jgi:aminobenzoyl-glutamate transport protein
MNSIITQVMLVFLVTGLAYGAGARTLTGTKAAIGAITKTFSGLGGLLFLFLIISQFVAYFSYSNMATIAAVHLGDALEQANIASIWLLLGFIIVIAIVSLVLAAIIPKWAIFAPIFIPLFMRFHVSPEIVLAAYRVGDSPANVVTPLMPYLALVVVFAQRYQRDAGVGTVVALMLPYYAALYVFWSAAFVAWYLLGIPFGPHP